jgi:hypothetical protein
MPESGPGYQRKDMGLTRLEPALWCRDAVY